MAEGVSPMFGKTLPCHLGIIPDGNGRWARENKVSIREGHLVGAQTSESIARNIFWRGIPYLSIWTLSEANLTDRSFLDVHNLNKIVAQKVDQMAKSLWVSEYGVRIQIFGRWRELLCLCSEERRLIEFAEQVTRCHNRNFLNIWHIYSGSTEEIQKFEKFAKILKLHPEVEVTSRLLESLRFGATLPPIDAILYTGLGSGESRYPERVWEQYLGRSTELLFSERLWPDFGERDLDLALRDYASRKLAQEKRKRSRIT